MFVPRSPQQSLFQTSMLLSEEKLERLKKTWAWPFRTKALPLIDEELFRDLFHENNGRPNKPVQTVIGVLILKEFENLTDNQALFNLEFNLAWQVALDLEPEEAHICQKTLHNFRAKLMENNGAQLLFVSMTDQIIKALGTKTDKQRADSTHILSNIARLTRLGLFCETIRVFLSDLRRLRPELYESTPAGLRGRYLKEDGEATRYGDAKSSQARRRLAVCARDAWRLVDRFAEEVVGLESYLLLKRLLDEQCEIVEVPPEPKPDDPDAGDPPVPVVLKEAKKVSSDSLQSPHDPDAKYSGHKGKGYEVQVAETHGNEDAPEIITFVEVTPSNASDEAATMPIVEALDEREIRPEELEADTTYASTDNVMDCAELGTELVGPVGGSGKDSSKKAEGELSKEDFVVDPTGECRTRCPAGQEAVSEERDPEKGRIRTVFDGSICAACEHREACPARLLKNGTCVFRITLKAAVLAHRRRYQETEEFRERYALRAGIEATNSELKGPHGLGRLRVRGGKRVSLAVYMKALACNVKRMLKHLVKEARKAADRALSHILDGEFFACLAQNAVCALFLIVGRFCRDSA